MLHPPNSISAARISRLLIIRPGGIGDAVLLLPALAALKRLVPDAEVHVLAERRNRAVFTLSPHVDSVFCYDSPDGLHKVYKSTYDAVIDTEQWYRLSAVVARLTRAPIVAGFGTNERRRMFNVAIDYSQHTHEATSFGMLFRAVFPGLPDVLPRDGIRIPKKAVDTATAVLAPMEGMRGKVALFPGSSIPEKKWPVECWQSLAHNLARVGYEIAVIGGSDVLKAAGIILKGLPGVNAAGTLTLSETAALLSRVQLLVSGDSGVLHLAWLLGTPTISLFGPSDEVKWAPRGDRHIVINKKLECSPCTTFGTTPRCLYGARCMIEISVDEVFNAACMLLTQEGVMPSLCCKRDWIERAL